MTAHAKLSASGSARWLACPGSVGLESRFPDKASPYAEEGTTAHAMAELKVNKLVTKMSKGDYDRQYSNLAANEYFSKEMDRLTDDYREYVREIMLGYSQKPTVFVEKKVDFGHIVPDGFGTVDCVILCDSDMHIIDLKYGKGVKVDPTENSQLKLYAVGALAEFSLFYNIKNVFLHIFQPRVANIESWQTTAEDLSNWAVGTVKPTAEIAYNGDGALQAGEHCRFCRAKAICRARADKNLELAQLDFKRPPLLSHAEVGAILQKASDLEKWAADLHEWALSEVLKGAEVAGWKAVHGRSTRAFTDQDGAFQKLIDGGINESMLYERKPITLTAVEKLIGKKEMTETLGEFITKTQGKPTLVPESDKREAITITTAKEDFSIGGNDNE